MGLTFPERCSSVAWADLDGDGWLDIVVGGGENWNDGNAILFPRQAWRNVEGKRFEDVTEATGLAGKGYGRSLAPCDYDGDGDTDLYLGNYRLQKNLLLRNDGGKLVEVVEAGVGGTHDPERFEDQGKKFGPLRGHTMGCAWADLDGDGWFDLWTSNLVHKSIGPVSIQGRRFYDTRGYVCDDSRLYLNPGARGGPFEEIRDRCGIATLPIGKLGQGFRGDELWSSAACADVDGDGDVDVYVPQIYRHIAYARGKLFLNRGDATFEEAKPPGGGWPLGCYGAAWGDVDGDGDLDLVTGGTDVVNGKPRLHLYRNVSKGGGIVSIRVVGSAPNTMAIGARVFLEVGERVQVRQVAGGGGAQGQQDDPVVRFGVGDAKSARAIVVWPSGAIRDLGDVAAGDTRKAVEPRGRPPKAEIRVIGRAGVGRPTKLGVRVSGRASRFRVRWDADGDNRFDDEGLQTAMTFTRNGFHLVRARLVRKDGTGIEVRRRVEVE
jgi:hypothetical protein